MVDASVDEFYSCTLCQSFAPNHVCVISPERLGLCGAYNWLDCKASNQINPTGPNQPIPKGICIDSSTGRVARSQRVRLPEHAPSGGTRRPVLHHAGPHDRLRLL